MDATIAALVAASAAAAAIYVFHRNSNTPTPAGKVSSGVYIYDTLQPAVVTAVQQTGYFALYDLAQLAGGKLFVVDEPKGEEEGELPKLPGGLPLRPKPPVPIQIDGTKAILLDIRECVPAAAAAAAGGGAAAAAAGGGAGAAAAAASGPFHSLPDGTMPELFRTTLNSAVIGIYDGRTPVSTAVFFSPTRALTAHHDAKPDVGDIISGRSNPSVAPVLKWKFKVVASSPADDLVVLEIVTGPSAGIFLPPAPQLPIVVINSSEVWVASFGISAAKMAAEAPKDIALGSFTDKTRISAVGERHFVYHANTGRGDSGGAVINLAGQLVGIHLGGWNDASPPPSPETAKSKGGGAGAVAIKNKDRAEAMGIAEVGSATRQSILKLASQLSNGGYGIYVCSPKVAAMCSVASISSAGAAGGGAGGGGAGSKRPLGGGSIGGGGKKGKK